MNCVTRFRKKKEINLTTGAVPSSEGSEQRSAALCRAAVETYRMHFVCPPRKSSQGSVSSHFPGNRLADYSTQRLFFQPKDKRNPVS